LEKINDDPLFCIIEDNLDEGFIHFDREPTNNITHFEAMKSRHKAFIWPFNEKNDISLLKGIHYRAGDPLATISDDLGSLDIGVLSLPNPFNRRQCDVFSPVKFMHDENFDCQTILSKNTDCRQIPELNAVHYISGFQLVKSPDAFANLSSVDQGMNEDNLLRPKPQVCIVLDKDEKVCVEPALNEALSEPTKVFVKKYFFEKLKTFVKINFGIF
jgi:hypothetical protein